MSQRQLPGPDDPKEMSLVGHLTELRTRLLLCIAALLLTFIVGFFVSDPVIEFMMLPIRHTAREPGREVVFEFHVAPDGTMRAPAGVRPDPEKMQRKGFAVTYDADPARNLPAQTYHFGEEKVQQLYYHNPIDPFMLKIKIGFMIAVALTSPFLLYQLWCFICPGLTTKERKLVKPMLGGALILFPIGAAFAYIMVAFLLHFMQHYVPKGMEPMLSVFEFLKLLTTMMIICGIVFELPLALAIAARVGLVTPEMLITYRRHAYVILAVISATFAPPDAYSMLIMLVVLVGLFEVSIAVCRPMAALHQRDLRDLEVEPAEVNAAETENPSN
jgi:sec-independent protein translocase protein TatC